MFKCLVAQIATNRCHIPLALTSNMKLVGFSLLCFGLSGVSSYVLSSAAGKALPGNSPERVYAVEGRYVTLPCPICTSLKTLVAMEWSRVDRSPLLTLYASRNGLELVKEKAEEYVNRTEMLEDGALKLSDVKRKDNGTYRIILNGPGMDQEAFISLIVAVAPEVQLTIERTAADALVLLCESKGWIPQPVISVLDNQRNALTVKTETGLFYVRASVDMASALGVTGNGTFICRVEIPGLNLARERSISITDEFGQSRERCNCYMAWIVASILVVFISTVAVLLFVSPLPAVKKLRCWLQTIFNWLICTESTTRGGTQWSPVPCPVQAVPDYTEYGDITKIRPTGASEDTAKAHQLHLKGLSGVDVSNELARRDLEPMKDFKEIITAVGNELQVHPALIAAIISRQSNAGTKLKPDGYGQSDPSSFGLMQVNKKYHVVKGGPYSKEHLELGVIILIQAVKTMWREKENWTKEEQLKGALAAYIVGEERVIPLESDCLDSVTPSKDFCSDVLARAQWFACNGF